MEMVEQILLQQLELEMDGVFSISDIQSSTLEMKGRVYACCIRSSMTYGSETTPLLVDVELKFERADADD